MSTCNACGTKRKLDTIHKAGKQLIKELPNFYALNPEFKGKVTQVSIDTPSANSEPGKKRRKKNKDGPVEEEKLEDVEDNKKKRKAEKVAKLEEEGGEVNIIDSR